MATNKESITLARGRLLHQLKNRVRIVSPLLVKDQEQCFILEILLKKRPGVTGVRRVSSVGSGADRLDPLTLSSPNLLKMLDLVFGNLGQSVKPVADKAAAGIEPNQPERTHHLFIEGMTCVSCT